MVAATREFVAANTDCFERSNGEGHVTGSAWVVDSHATRAVLVHHRRLDRWLQPGGHADGDPDIRAVARREAEEETGLQSLRAASPGIYDIDVHRIPAAGATPSHLHYDVRFAFFADPAEAPAVGEESVAVAWVALDRLAELGADASVLRLAAKTAGLPGPPPSLNR
jgi:8-oxo-dGTP pyrophosphatase MutT (NUDIX family)